MFFRNMTLFAKNHTLLFVLLLVTQTTAILVILLSYGVYMNNRYVLQEYEADHKSFGIDFTGEEPESMVALAKEAFPEILKGYEECIERCYVAATASCYYDISGLEDYSYSTIDIETGELIKVEQFTEATVVFHFGIQDGKYSGKSYWEEGLEGAWFSEKGMNEGLNQCIASRLCYQLSPNKAILEGRTYDIIGSEGQGGKVAFRACSFIMPLESMADEMTLNHLSIELTRFLTKEERKDLTSEFEAAFRGYGTIDDISAVFSIDEKATMYTTMFATILMAALAAYTICLIYRYVMEKRMQMTAIYQICGSTRGQTMRIYMVEMVVLLLVSAGIGYVLFAWGIKPLLMKQYEWFGVVCTTRMQVSLTMIYLIIVLVATITLIGKSLRKTPKEVLRECGG